MKKETLCWRCQNFSKCSWSRGVPVENWDAEPTVVQDWSDGVLEEIHSYCVNSCPQFKSDIAGTQTNIVEMAKILDVSVRTLFRELARSEARVKKAFEAKGYKLTIYKAYVLKTYYLNKIGGGNESQNQ